MHMIPTLEIQTRADRTIRANRRQASIRADRRHNKVSLLSRSRAVRENRDEESRLARFTH